MDESAFRTDDGVPLTAVTAEEMRAVDRVAVEDAGLHLRQMMENAGRTLAEHLLATTEGPVTVLAGDGGNGGGGLACARHLLNHGRTVDVRLDREPGALSGVTAHQFSILDATDCSIGVGDDTEPGATVVDALVGYGLSGPLRGTGAELVAALDARDQPVVSLDVPSGLDATTGDRPGPSVTADRVVTLALPKTGLRSVAARLLLADISVPATVYAALDIPYEPPFGPDYLVPIEAV